MLYISVMQRDELMWLAGLLEGEGYFGATGARGCDKRYAVVNLSMTDEDVVRRAAKLMESSVNGPYQPRTRPHVRPHWVAKLTGRRAVALLHELLPHMGVRRADRIRSVLSEVTEPVYGTEKRRRACSP